MESGASCAAGRGCQLALGIMPTVPASSRPGFSGKTDATRVAFTMLALAKFFFVNKRF